MVLATAGLIYINAGSPGFCPSYPLIGTPACIVVGVFFSLILVSLFLKGSLGDYIFYSAATAAFLSSILFSAKEVLGLSSCPRLFEIPLPLCFTVFPTMALLMFLKYRGRSTSEQARIG